MSRLPIWVKDHKLYVFCVYIYSRDVIHELSAYVGEILVRVGVLHAYIFS